MHRRLISLSGFGFWYLQMQETSTDHVCVPQTAIMCQEMLFRDYIKITKLIRHSAALPEQCVRHEAQHYHEESSNMQ